MKKHISEEQMSELSDKGINKLAKWNNGRYLAKNLSIGQMIEFLGDDWWERPHDCSLNYSSDVWSCDFDTNDYLCDSLWQAVREVLNE